MKIAIDESVELEFDSWSLKEASAILNEAARKAGDRRDQILRAMFTILLFGHIEQQNPHTMNRFIDTVNSVAKQLEKPEAENDS